MTAMLTLTEEECKDPMCISNDEHWGRFRVCLSLQFPMLSELLADIEPIEVDGSRIVMMTTERAKSFFLMKNVNLFRKAMCMFFDMDEKIEIEVHCHPSAPHPEIMVLNPMIPSNDGIDLLN